MSLLRLESISKQYGGVKALSQVSLEIREGDIHAVVGENGAGKSTLMKIISGVIQPSEGRMFHGDRQLHFKTTCDAEDEGIFIIHQEPVFFADLSVMENIFIRKEPKNSLGFIDWGVMRKEAEEALRYLGVQDDILDTPMGLLPIGTQQMVLIAKGVHRKSKLLILDEPTSILSFEESKRLFRIIKELAAKGVALLYISHRIPEILELSDRVSVLKDGVLMDTLPKVGCTADKLLEMMSGRSIQKDFIFKEQTGGETIFSAENCSSPGAFRDVSFQLQKGRILGLYGLIGAGRTELAQSIIGERPYSGRLLFKGKAFHPKNAKEAYASGIVYLPEDRITQGTFPIEKIKVNMMAGLLSKLCSSYGIYCASREKEIVRLSMGTYAVKAGDMEDPIQSLSGGNQQKVLFTRCLLHEPEILILDEPTRGIDVKTKMEIYKLIVSLAEKGTGILLISSELPEILALTDSVYVLYEGNPAAFLNGADCTEDNILKAALGS